jgi:transposase
MRAVCDNPSHMADVRDPQRIVLSARGRARLEEVARSGVPNLARRARIILARADGLTLGAIADSVGLHRDSVRRWLTRYRSRGIEGLHHGNAGKPKNVIFDPAICAEIRRRASSPPSAFAEPWALWSLYKLRDHIIRNQIVRTISVERLRQLLREGRYSRRHWHQPTRIGPLDPDVRRQLVDLVRHPEPERAQRARAVLAIADGGSINSVASTLHLGKGNVRRWLDEFRIGGIVGLSADDQGPGESLQGARGTEKPSSFPLSRPQQRILRRDGAG